MKILVIQLQPIGDVLRATPLVSSLRKRYPDSYIGFCVLDRYKEILDGNPKLDGIFPIPRARWQGLSKKVPLNEVLDELSSFIKDLQAHGFDWVINLHNTYMSAMIAYLVRAKTVSGFMMNEVGGTYFSKGWKATPSHLLKGDLNVVSSYLVSCGINPDGERLEIYLSDDEILSAKRSLMGNGICEGDLLVGLNPGAGRKERMWPVDRFAKVGDELMKNYNAKIIIFGGQMEVGIARKMLDLMESQPINLAGKTTLRELCAIIKMCNLFITNDTGPMHIAGALGVPIIGIFGPSSRHIASPFGANHIAIQVDLPCIPCISPCEERRCLNLIRVEDVLAKVREILDG